MAKASATDQAHVVLAVGKEAILVQRVIEGGVQGEIPRGDAVAETEYFHIKESNTPENFC